MYEPMGNEEFATAYSETHTKCAVCETPVLLPEMTDIHDNPESVKCSCGAILCLDCDAEGTAFGCGVDGCDAGARGE